MSIKCNIDRWVVLNIDRYRRVGIIGQESIGRCEQVHIDRCRIAKPAKSLNSESRLYESKGMEITNRTLDKQYELQKHLSITLIKRSSQTQNENPNFLKNLRFRVHTWNVDFGSGFNSYRVKKPSGFRRRTDEIRQESREKRGVFVFGFVCECGRGNGPISSEISVLTVYISASIDGSNASSIDVLLKDKS